MTRTAQVMAGAAHGGAELFFERLCGGLHGAGDPVLAVIRRDAARAETLRRAGVKAIELQFGSPLDVLTRRRLRVALARFQPRVAVSWMNRATQHMPRGDWVHVGRLGGYYRLDHYARCDHLVGNTRGIVAWLRQQGWPPARTHYLPNFTDDFAALSPAAELAGDGPLLLGLGRLHRDKGFDTLLHALSHLPNVRLAIAGEGPERGRLDQLARSLGVASRTSFLGWRRDPGGLLRAADLFVCSSRVEPLGNMVIEAWSAGTPVVAVAAAGPAELIRDGVDGVLVPPEDPAALAAAIARLLGRGGPGAELAAAGRRRYEGEFRAPTVLAAWRGFLATVQRA